MFTKQCAALNRKRQAYEEALGELDKMIKPKVEFQCAIVHQPGDGFCLLNEDDGIALAPLADCLSVMYRKGILSVKDHKEICI